MSIDYRERYQNARDEIDELKERIRQIKAALAPVESWPVEWGLCANEARYLSLLLECHLVSKANFEAIHMISNRDLMPDSTMPGVYLSRLRNKMRNLPILIVNMHGVGWYLDAKSKAFLRKVQQEMGQ